MYTSPIEVKLSEHFSVLKTVEFDREQYEQGWHDRDSQIVRCNDCRWYENDGFHTNCQIMRFCVEAEDYCSRGERRVKE